MRNRLLIKEEIKTALRKLIKEEITKKSDYQSVGLGGVNNPEDVEHILNLFSDPKVGFATDIEKIKRECSTENDFKKIGECKKFQDFIAEYQKTKVFPTGFNDSRIDPGMQTITLLYNTVLETDEKPKELSPGSEIELSGEIVPPKSLDYLVDFVIDNIEGGYYHPAMKPYLKGGANLLDSGETLYGIDRKHGGDINTSANGKAFWAGVDEESGWAKNTGLPKWKYGDIPKNPTLRKLVHQMMIDVYKSHKRTFKVAPEIEKLIESDARLQLHFFYACWNGPGFFQWFYNDLVKFLKQNPNPDIKAVVEASLESRARHAGSKKASRMRQLMAKL